MEESSFFTTTTGTTRSDESGSAKDDDDGKGYRKKLSPSLGETLITSRDRSDFTLESQRDSWQLHFQTPWDEWYEKIIRLDSQELVLEHNNKRYYYKRKNLTDGRP